MPTLTVGPTSTFPTIAAAMAAATAGDTIYCSPATATKPPRSPIAG